MSSQSFLIKIKRNHHHAALNDLFTHETSSCTVSS